MGEAKRDSLPKYPKAAAAGDAGVRLVERLVGDQLGWVFRDESKVDFGIDATIEAIVDDEATGRLIAVQIKSGPSFFREPTADGRGFVYRGKEKHLNYWLNHSLPVIVVICDPGEGEAYYAEINQVNSRATEKGWTTVIPRDQPLDASALPNLLRLAKGPQRADLIELSLLMFLVDRWGDRLKVASTIDMPRDWHWFPYMIEITGETGGFFGVDFIDTALRRLDRNVLAEEEKWRRYNANQTYDIDLLLFAVGEPDATRPGSEVMAYLEEHPQIHLHRLIYDPPRELTEIDEEDRIIWFMPGEDEREERYEPEGPGEAPPPDAEFGEEPPF